MRIENQKIEEAIKSSLSMTEASKKLGISVATLRKYAIPLGIWKPNVGLKGSKKSWQKKISLDDILSNEKPCQSSKLKIKLFEAGIKENRCETCGISSWNGKEINCHLDHIDGNPYNNKLENLRIICPNCHSQTETYCRGQGKNANVAK